MCVYLSMCLYIYIYVHNIHEAGSRTQADGNQIRQGAGQRVRESSDLQFNNLHFNLSLETNEIATRAAERSMRLCDCLKRRLLK